MAATWVIVAALLAVARAQYLTDSYGLLQATRANPVFLADDSDAGLAQWVPVTPQGMYQAAAQSKAAQEAVAKTFAAHNQPLFSQQGKWISARALANAAQDINPAAPVVQNQPWFSQQAKWISARALANAAQDISPTAPAAPAAPVVQNQHLFSQQGKWISARALANAACPGCYSQHPLVFGDAVTSPKALFTTPQTPAGAQVAILEDGTPILVGPATKHLYARQAAQVYAGANIANLIQEDDTPALVGLAHQGFAQGPKQQVFFQNDAPIQVFPVQGETFQPVQPLAVIAQGAVFPNNRQVHADALASASKHNMCSAFPSLC